MIDEGTALGFGLREQAAVFQRREDDDSGLASSRHLLRRAFDGRIDDGAEPVLGILEAPHRTGSIWLSNWTDT